MIDLKNYDVVAEKCLAFIKAQMNVNDYTLFPKLKEAYAESHRGRVIGTVEMPSNAYIEFPSYIYCDQFYDETYQGVCSGGHQNTGEARVNLGVEVSTLTDGKYTSAVCPLYSDGTWRTESITRTTEIYGVNGKETQRIIYWSKKDKIINESGSNGIKGFALKYFNWVDDEGNPFDVENLPATVKIGASVSGQVLMKVETYVLKPELVDEEEIDNAIPYYPDYMADFYTLADVEYLTASTNVMYDGVVSASDLKENPAPIPNAPEPFIRDVVFSPSGDTNSLEVAWISNFKDPCTIQVGNNTYTVNSQEIEDGYRSYKCTVKAQIGTEFKYTVSGKGISVSGLISYPNTNVYRICGDPQLIDETSAQNWYKSQEIESPFNKKPTLMLSMGDQIDSITSAPLKKQQYTMFAHEQKAPIMVVRGNHDKNDSFLAHYSMPNCKVADYYFIHNDTLFVVIDTNHLDFDVHKAVIEEGLNSGEYTTAILVMHHSMYTVGSNAYTDRTVQLRNNLGEYIQSKPFHVVLSGHDHIYCRNTIGNKMYILAPSSSGSKYYKVENPNEPWADVYMELKVPCVIDMEIEASVINFSLLDNMGNILDEFTVSK